MAEEFGKIILKRKSSNLNWRNNFKILINGKEQGEIGNDSTKKFEVPAGEVNIEAKIFWCGSNVFRTNICSGDTIYLTVGSGMKYYFAFVSMVPIYLIVTLFNLGIPKEIKTSLVIIPIAGILYLFYYFTLGKNKYLKIEAD